MKSVKRCARSRKSPSSRTGTTFIISGSVSSTPHSSAIFRFYLVRKILSEPVLWQGFRWSIVIYPNGTVSDTAGKVGAFITIKSVNASLWTLDVTFSLSINERPPAKATCCFRNDADIWGFKDIVSKDVLDETKPIVAHAQIFLTSKNPAPSNLEPPAAAKHPLLALSPFFNDEATSDVMLRCGERTFHVHKIVLLASSEYFAALWRKGSWKEGGSTELKIEDAEPEILEVVLQYLYQGEPGLPATLSWSEYCNILEACSFFQVQSLQDVLITKLSSLLSADNLVGIYVIAKKLELAKLCTNILEFVRMRYSAIREHRKALLASIREDFPNCEELLDCLIDAAEQFVPPKKTS